MDALARLAAFAATATPPPAHRARAVDAFLDTLGCIALGRDAPPTRAALALAEWGDGGVPLPFTDTRLAPPWAALTGGAAAHAYDLADYTLAANDHPSAVLVPALLTQDASGAEILDAYLIGLEVIFRLGHALNMAHYNAGWHTTRTIDGVGAAAAMARLRGLDTTRMAAAMSLATSVGGGFVSQFGTMAKPLHAGLSAMAGLMACRLAEGGATAASGVLDGRASLLSISPGAPGFALDDLGMSWGLDTHGLGAKLYPSCGYTHRAIDGALEARALLGAPPPEAVAEMTLSLPDFHLAILPYGVPETTDEALFSAPWCAAVAFAIGACTSADFTPEGLARPAIRALAARTRAAPRIPRDPQINLDPADPDRVHVHLKDGREAEVAVDLWTGAPGRDLGRAGLVAKFRDLCKTARIDPARRDAVETAALALSEAPSLTNLRTALA